MDTVLVQDGLNHRLTVITPGRTVTRGHSLSAFRGTLSSGRVLGTLSDGRVVVTQTISQRGAISGQARYLRDTIAVVAATFDVSRADTIVRIAGVESTIQTGTTGAGPRVNGNPLPTSGGSWTQRGIAFSYSPFYALRGDRLWVTSSERPDLYLSTTRTSRGVTPDGNLLSITRRTDARLIPVSTVRDKYEAWVVGLASKSDRYNPAAERARVRGMLDISADGRIAARANTPANLSVMNISTDHITGVMRDDLNVDYVVVYRIVRG